MAVNVAAKPNKTPSLSVPKLFLLFSILSLALFLILIFPTATTTTLLHPSLSSLSSSSSSSINVYVADLPRSLNYALLDRYWSSFSDSRLPSDADHDTLHSSTHPTAQFPPYPESPLIKQYSAEYWITGDLMTPPQHRATSFAKRVLDPRLADVVFVPFFATLSTEMQLGANKAAFRKKHGNEDYHRQRQVMDTVKTTQSWNRSGGRDHVFVLTGWY